MKKLIFVVIASLMFTSCLSTMFAPTEYVSIKEPTDVIETKISTYKETNEYQKKFVSKDKMGNRHEWIIYDENYFSVDGIVYAYKYHDLMTYSLVIAQSYTLNDTAKVIGFHGYASPINNPETVVSFIFAGELFAQKGYSSTYEASQIKGVSFRGIQGDEGYIDDFGRWQTYTWQDYYEQVFSTRNKNVKKIMYSAMSLK